jgi:hypothetical protein
LRWIRIFRPLELSAENKRLMLERIIDQRILSSGGRQDPTKCATDAQIREYRNRELVARFGSQEALLARTRAVGLDAATLREIISRRLVLLKLYRLPLSLVCAGSAGRDRPSLSRGRSSKNEKPRPGNIRSLDEMRSEIEAQLSRRKDQWRAGSLPR